MRKRKGDHIIVHNGGAGFECLHCGAVDRVTLPIPVDVWLAWGKLFDGKHRRCPPMPVAVDETKAVKA